MFLLKKAFQGLKTSYNFVREWTDPAFEGSPYSSEVELAKSVETKKAFSFKRKFAWR